MIFGSKKLTNERMTMEQIKSIGDMLRSMQGEILDLKAGKLSESAGRVISRFRALQLKAAELSLQYARLDRRLRPDRPVLLLSNGNESKARKRAPKRARA